MKIEKLISGGGAFIWHLRAIHSINKTYTYAIC